MAGLDPRYVLPSRKKITRKLLPLKYEQERYSLQTMLTNVDHIAITTNLSTSRRTKSYITLTAHYLCPSPSCDLQTAVLATRLVTATHTTKNIAAVKKDVLEEWDIGKKFLQL